MVRAMRSRVMPTTHITRAAQRRVSVRCLLAHCGEFHATYERGVAGRPPSARCAAGQSKLHNNHLATEARVAMRVCAWAVATWRHRAAPVALLAVHAGAGTRGASRLARCRQASHRGDYD